MSSVPFNPLDKLTLGKSIAAALLQCAAQSLPPSVSFKGAGIYAIYYKGTFPAYCELARQKSAESCPPIYVGKAVPAGARKAGLGAGLDPKKVLYQRLKQHSKSISEVANLSLADFTCKYLVCEDIWIPLGERLLLQTFRPVWNVLLDGFGIHDPGKGRKQQVASRWDTVHPGRKIAAKRAPHPSSAEELGQLVQDFFAGRPVETLSPIEAMSAEGDEDTSE